MKRAQSTVGMPIGLIFSIFLIVVFIIAAFIAVSFFLDLGGTSEVGLFYQDLQKAVDDARQSQESSFAFKLSLPSNIQKVCFANLTSTITGLDSDYQQIESFFLVEANTFVLPPQNANGLEYKQINNIDLEKITSISNPYCVSSSGTLTVSKGFYDKFVTLQ